MSKTIIFANGISENPKANLKFIKPNDTIICADGGTLNALALGLTPDLIVGDLDSLPGTTIAQMRRQGVEIQQHPVKKNETDLELALAAATARGAKEILILTAFGGRIDQLLANVFLLTRPEWQSARLNLAEGRQQAWLMRGPDEITITGKSGDTLSLVALSPSVRGIALLGVEWLLENTDIDLGSTLTISNTFSTEQVTVRIASGLGLVVHIVNE